MKRNEFKLLLEDWKKNLIVESPDDVPSIDKDDLDYFFSDEENSAMSDYDYNTPTYSSDSEEHIDGFSGVYDDDPTYTSGDYSSTGDYNLDGERIDDLLPGVDEMHDDDNDGF